MEDWITDKLKFYQIILKKLLVLEIERKRPKRYARYFLTMC